MVQTLLLLGTRNRLKNKDASEEVARFSVLKRGFFLAAGSGIVPILGWLVQFGLSCNESFGGSWQVAAENFGGRFHRCELRSRRDAAADATCNHFKRR